MDKKMVARKQHFGKEIKGVILTQKHGYFTNRLNMIVLVGHKSPTGVCK